jgi:hypothetical protein
MQQNGATMMTKRKRGRPRKDESDLAEYKNVSIRVEVTEELKRAREVLTARLGFKPTISQTIHFLIKECITERLPCAAKKKSS